MDPTIFSNFSSGWCLSAISFKNDIKSYPYAYSNRRYSSSQIAEQLRENIVFIWISGEQQPEFRSKV
ncbi:transposase [Bacillus sp. AL-1R]